MPIRTGSRLDQLIALRRRVDLEIEQERRRPTLYANLGRPPTGVEPVSDSPSREECKRIMQRLGCSTFDVKEWAVGVGLLDAVHRGTVRGDLVRAYANTHTAEQVTE